MVRETFQRELCDVQREVVQLGSLVEDAIVQAVDALVRRDPEAARAVIASDRKLNRLRFDLEHKALVLIATQQPMACDLRALAAVMEICTELERIGDYAKGIGRITIMLPLGTSRETPPAIPEMAAKVRHMLHVSLQAFLHRDVELARSLPSTDDEVDALYNQAYNELLATIISDPQTIDPATHLLWAAHNLERAADRATNICERVVFTATGRMTETGSAQQEPPCAD
jgi:phosphate transport system protein